MLSPTRLPPRPVSIPHPLAHILCAHVSRHSCRPKTDANYIHPRYGKFNTDLGSANRSVGGAQKSERTQYEMLRCKNTRRESNPRTDKLRFFSAFRAWNAYLAFHPFPASWPPWQVHPTVTPPPHPLPAASSAQVPLRQCHPPWQTPDAWRWCRPGSKA